MKRPRAPRRAIESAAQRGYFAEVFIRERADWRWEAIYSIPNEGKRSPENAGRMKAEGLRKGNLDVICPVPIGRHTGLVIEFKSDKGDLSPNQVRRAKLFAKAGHAIYIARSAEQGIFITKKYLAGEL